MTKIERTILSSEISQMIKENRTNWQNLKEEISQNGYQSHYSSQEYFDMPIKYIILSLSKNEKQSLISEWKNRKERILFDSDQKYLKQYELFVMEELVSRASKATYWM